jgi:hypothetical protein
VQFIDWQSDGLPALLVLVLYGIVLLMMVLRLVHRNIAVGRLMLPAIAWHLAVMLFTLLWVIPHYAGETGADCYGYHYEGLRVAELLRAGQWSQIPWGFGTQAIEIFTGFLYLPAGGDIYGVEFFSAVLGLCACFFFCLAFSENVDSSRVRRYSKIIIFLPSFGLWTGMFGKDSLIALGLGLATYGYASVLKGRKQGFFYLVGGILITTIIRPHISFAFGAAAATSFILGLTRNRKASVLFKIQIVVMLLVMFVSLAFVAQRFLQLDDVSAQALEQYGQERSAANDVGGSAVEVSTGGGMAGILIGFPRAVVRILLQPFPWEVHNFSLGLAAAENLFIFAFIVSHLGRVRHLFRRILREPFILFCTLLALALLLMFSLLPNLGLLSRQRAQLLPFVFAPLVAAEFSRRRQAPLQPGAFYGAAPIRGRVGSELPAHPSRT